MTSNNIVMFPRDKMASPPQDIEEVKLSISKIREDHIDHITSETVDYLRYRFHEEGYDLFSENSAQYVAMVIESIKSALYFSVGIDHPFQKHAEEMFSFMSDDYVESTEHEKDDNDD